MFFSVEKSKVANRLKRVFPKFEADRSHVRGVNGRPIVAQKLSHAESVENRRYKKNCMWHAKAGDRLWCLGAGLWD